ncbi:MAG: hypothetical protein ACXVCP_17065 [Bdellovibrio sp.]
MKQLILLISILCFAKTSLASGSYVFQSTFENLGADYVDRLAKIKTDILNNLTVDKQNSCLQRYNQILKDDLLDIRIALGYFDWTTGNEVSYRGANYGLSPSIDIGAFYALRHLLLSACHGETRFCGFHQDTKNPNLFLKQVKIHGRIVKAQIQMHFSSATEFLNNNLRSYANEQQQRSKFMEAFFKQALGNADAVFYFGHSRNGGGPDFSPPIFVNGKNKVNYDGYYEIQKPGFKKLIQALQGPNTLPILGLMSCASRMHFLKKVQAASPTTGVITSKDVLNVDYVYTALIGGVDAILRGQCQHGFYESLRLTTKNQEHITMDGMFL